MMPKGISSEEKAIAMNALIECNRLQLLSKSDGQPFFKLISEETANRMRNLSYEEQLIYQVVSDSG